MNNAKLINAPHKLLLPFYLFHYFFLFFSLCLGICGENKYYFPINRPASDCCCGVKLRKA